MILFFIHISVEGTKWQLSDSPKNGLLEIEKLAYLFSCATQLMPTDFTTRSHCFVHIRIYFNH